MAHTHTHTQASLTFIKINPTYKKCREQQLCTNDRLVELTASDNVLKRLPVRAAKESAERSFCVWTRTVDSISRIITMNARRRNPLTTQCNYVQALSPLQCCIVVACLLTIVHLLCCGLSRIYTEFQPLPWSLEAGHLTFCRGGSAACHLDGEK